MPNLSESPNILSITSFFSSSNFISNSSLFFAVFFFLDLSENFLVNILVKETPPANATIPPTPVIPKAPIKVAVPATINPFFRILPTIFPYFLNPLAISF